jgi:hypothetical protein
MLTTPPWAARRELAAAVLAGAMLLAGCSSTNPADTGADPRAASQGFIHAPGPCEQSMINSAFMDAFNRLPTGEGNTGECWPDYYGTGAPWDYQYLVEKVLNSKVCGDPWIGQALLEANRRYAMVLDIPVPGVVGHSGLCNTHLYNYGQYSSYVDLRAKVFRALDLMSTNDLILYQDGSADLNGVRYPPGEVVIVSPATNEVTSAANSTAERPAPKASNIGGPPTSGDPDPWAWWVPLGQGEGLAGDADPAAGN